MTICSNLVFNNEILINEALSNKYIFVLESIPTSYLISKFTDADVQKIVLEMNQQGLQDLQRDIFIEKNQDLKNFLLYVQTIDMPEISVGYSTTGTKFIDIKHMDGKIEMGNLTMNVMVDENWMIYKMLYYWLLAAHNPQEYMKFGEVEYFKKFYVNGSLIILDNHYEQVFQVEFSNLHPASLGTVNLKETDAEKLILPVEWIHMGMTPSDKYVLKRV
jgi:hypothetical protein